MSLWSDWNFKHSYDSLKENKSVDTLIIGGGMVGVQSMYFLKEQNNVMLVEANKIGQSVSANTTGKINYLQESTFGYLILKGSLTKASMYLASQLEGIGLFQDIILKERIDCDFEQVHSYLVTNQENKVPSLKKIKNFLEDKGIAVLEEIPKDTSFSYGIGVDHTYVFHPLKYMDGLLNCLDSSCIYEQTRIVKICRQGDLYKCYTNTGYQILAKNVICSCHYPFFLFPYFLPIKTTIEKSYLCAYPVSENKKYTYITMESPSLSTRFYESKKKIYQLFLSDSHKTSVKQDDKKHFDNLLNQVPDVQMLWSNVDILTFDHMPFIGEIKKNLYLATGFQTWGMINSIVSAKMISQNILGHSSVYRSLFSPHRTFLLRTIYSVPYLFYNAFSFVRSKWYKKSWYSNNLSFFRKNGKLIACYQDENNEKHFVYPVCPHMKCNLIFNEREKTWDCPCHSSRFTLDGDVMKGPSIYSIRYHNDK